MSTTRCVGVSFRKYPIPYAMSTRTRTGQSLVFLKIKDNIVLPIRGVSKYKEIHDRDIWEIVIFAL